MKIDISHRTILWVTAILVLIFLGMRTDFTAERAQGQKELTIYGFKIGNNFDIQRIDSHPRYRGPGVVEEPIDHIDITRLGIFALIGEHKYLLIAITLLIGFVLFVSIKKKQGGADIKGEMR